MITLLAQQIEDLLPQTQCTKCGFAGCAPYARAIADGTAQINQCPPGGQEGVVRLAHLLGRAALPLNPDNGVERPRPLAVIDESLCIGCTLCLQACPVDAIAGAAKLMHTVIDAQCTGCDLCVAPCPVDCITMVPVTGDATGWHAWTQAQADAARRHHDRRLARQAAEQEAARQRLAERVAQAAREEAARAASPNATPAAGTPAAGTTGATDARAIDAQRTDAQNTGAQNTDASNAQAQADAAQARKHAIIQAAVERARLRRLADTPSNDPR
ncbi:MAG: electron transport complex subunit RsxB [Janthinobacterium lividum]